MRFVQIGAGRLYSYYRGLRACKGKFIKFVSNRTD